MAAMDSEVGFSECLQGFQVQNAMDAVAVSVSATEGFSRANFNRPHCSGRYESCRCNGKVRWVRSPSEGEYKPPPSPASARRAADSSSMAQRCSPP